jgi:hypothetical protein
MHRLTTDQGRRAWVQLLGALPRRSELRVVTRLTGTRDPLLAPAGLFCVGTPHTITVHFTTDPRYRSYRVERRVGPKEPFEEIGTVATPPFVSGATGSLDLLRGMLDSGSQTPSASDLFLADGNTLETGAYGVARVVGPGQRFWDLPRGAVSRSAASMEFLFLLDGGGIGRAWWSGGVLRPGIGEARAQDGVIRDQQDTGRPASGTLRYELEPDADLFTPRVRLTAEVVAAGARWPAASSCRTRWPTR